MIVNINVLFFNDYWDFINCNPIIINYYLIHFTKFRQP